MSGVCQVKGKRVRKVVLISLSYSGCCEKVVKKCVFFVVVLLRVKELLLPLHPLSDGTGKKRRKESKKEMTRAERLESRSGAEKSVPGKFIEAVAAGRTRTPWRKTRIIQLRHSKAKYNGEFDPGSG